MSSAANHRARSCRSFHRHSSGMTGVKQMRITRRAHQHSGTGASLIFRFKAFRQWLRAQHMARKTAEEDGAEA